MAPKMSLKKFNFFFHFFLNVDEAQVAPCAADIAKVLLFKVNLCRTLKNPRKNGRSWTKVSTFPYPLLPVIRDKG